jgi:hypothetical protein
MKPRRRKKLCRRKKKRKKLLRKKKRQRNKRRRNKLGRLRERNQKCQMNLNQTSKARMLMLNPILQRNKIRNNSPKSRK